MAKGIENPSQFAIVQRAAKLTLPVFDTGQQTLLESEWREENKRRKRFYRISGDGRRVFSALTSEWKALNASLKKIL